MSLSDACLLLPKTNGKHPNPRTLSRWGKVGIRGVRLSIERVGGRWYTSEAAIESFVSQCNGGELGVDDAQHLSPKRSKREMDRIDRELRRRGIRSDKKTYDGTGVLGLRA